MFDGTYVAYDYPTMLSDTPVGRSILIRNVGTTPVYLSTYANATVSWGVRLNPDDTKVWDAGDMLYAVAEPGTTGSINVSLNSGEYASPSAIAQQILGQGLAAQVAQQIALNGAPSIDAPEVLYETPPGTPWVTWNVPVSVPLITGLNKFQSLRIFIDIGNASGNRSTRQCMITYPIASMPSQAVNREVVYLGAGDLQGYHEMVVPVRGDSVVIQISGSNYSSTPDNIRVLVVGSYRPVPRLRYRYFSTYNNTRDFDLVQGRVGVSLTAGASTYEDIGVISGDAVLHYTTSHPTNTGGGFRFGILNAEDFTSYGFFNVYETQPRGFAVPLFLPPRPLRISMSNTCTGSVTGSFSVYMKG